jgi:hypothetical protein
MRRTIFFLIAAAAAVLLAQVGDAAGARGLVLTGQVTSDGAAAAGATVIAQAMPAGGGTQSPVQVGYGSTAPDGTYTVNAQLSSLPEGYVNPDDSVNLTLIAMRSGYLWSDSFPVASSATSYNDNLTNGAMNAAFKAAERSAMSKAAASSGSGKPDKARTDAIVMAGCGGSWSGPQGPYQVKIGDVSADQIATGEMSYFSGSSTTTTLGVAYYNGSSWSVNGTASSAASQNSGWDQANLQTQRMFSLWTQHTFTNCFGQAWREPDYYAGKGQQISIAHPTYKYCTGPYYNGGRWFTTTATNGTYSDGLTVLGLNLSSQAGWSTSMEIQFHFTGKGWICGNTNQYDSSPRVEADGSYQTP